MRGTRFLVLACVATASGRAAAAPKVLRVDEMVRMMKSSETEYAVSSLSGLKGVKVEDLPRLLYPRMVSPIELGQVETVEGERRVVPAPCDGAKAKLAKGEKLFAEHQYATAGSVYDEAVALAPQCYLAEAYLGDAFMFSGDAQLALKHYDRALALNPDDASVRLFRSTAYRHLGRRREMIDELRWAMALRPHNPAIVKMFKDARPRAPLRLRDVGVIPRGFARREKAGVAIYADEQSPWMAYALCKGLWLGEPAHREEMTGSAEKRFSLAEERECAIALLTAYDSGPRKRDESLDRLHRISEEGLGNAWIVYEWGSRVDPQIVLKVPKELQQQVHDLVAKYVLVEAE